MEIPELPERQPPKELNAIPPGKLFEFIATKEKKLRAQLSNPLPETIESLAYTLNEYIVHHFDELPEVVGAGRDVYEMKEVESSNPDAVLITHRLKPLADANNMRDYEQHELKGRLYGFHRGVANDLRAYIDMGLELKELMGGVYRPMLSVGIEESSLQFVEYSLEEKMSYIDKHLEEIKAETASEAKELLSILRQTKLPMVEKLRKIASLFTNIVLDEKASAQFVDAVIEVIKYKLRLDLPHDIVTTLHNVVTSGLHTKSHNRITDETTFTGVSVEVGIAGESAHPWLGLFFFQETNKNSEPVSIQVPVQYITSIYRSES